MKRDAGGSPGCERCGFQVSTALGAAGRRQISVLTASQARTAELSPRDPQPPEQVSFSLSLLLSLPVWDGPLSDCWRVRLGVAKSRRE